MISNDSCRRFSGTKAENTLPIFFSVLNRLGEVGGEFNHLRGIVDGLQTLTDGTLSVNCIGSNVLGIGDVKVLDMLGCKIQENSAEISANFFDKQLSNSCKIL